VKRVQAGERKKRGAGRKTSTRMLRTTAVRLVLILAHWSCPLAHLRACRASTHIALCHVAPGTGEALRTCEKGKRATCIPVAVSAVADSHIGARKAARASRSAWRRGDPLTRKPASSCRFRPARAPAYAVSAACIHNMHWTCAAYTGRQQAMWACGSVEGLSNADTRPRAHGAGLSSSNCTVIVRSCDGWALGAYSCNQGRHRNEYDEGPARLISPHFVPVPGWTVARKGPGGQRRRRWRCHRRKPVLAVQRRLDAARYAVYRSPADRRAPVIRLSERLHARLARPDTCRAE
jgi:hypothetical protein